jgi:hypothetical protein
MDGNTSRPRPVVVSRLVTCWGWHIEKVEPHPFLRRRQTKPSFVVALVVSVLFDVVLPLSVFVRQTSFVGVLAGVAGLSLQEIQSLLDGPLAAWLFRLEQQRDVLHNSFKHSQSLGDNWGNDTFNIATVDLTASSKSTNRCNM